MVVNLHVDLETLQLIQGPGQRSAVSSLRFKRGDAARLRVVFLESGITPVTIGNPSGLEIQIGIKPRNQFDHSYLAHSADWSMPAEGDDTPTYECELSFNTLQLNSALNVGSATVEELPEITLMGEITWQEGNGEPTSTRTFLVVVENDVNRGTEGAPSDANPGNITLTGTIAASNLSGTNTGDQDLSGLAPIAHTHVVADIVSVASQRLIGRHTVGNGASQEVGVGNGLEFSGSGIRRSALTGDVTASAGSNATTIANDAVSNTKLADMATATIKGRTTAGTGDPEDLTAAQARTVLGLGTAATRSTGTTENTIPLLGAGGKLASSLLPSIAITETLSVANAAARLALTSAQAQGKIVIEADTGRSFGLITGGSPATSANWLQVGDRDITAADITDSTTAGRALLTATDAPAQITALGAETPAGATTKANAAQAFAIQRANHTGTQAQSTVTNLVSDLAAKETPAGAAAQIEAERTAAATLTNKTITSPSGLVKADVGLANVDNTSDASKPVSTAQQTALNLKANLASPTFTGTPTLPTGSIGTTQTAGNSTTALATTAFVTTADNLKANLASPTFTGTVNGITKSMVGLGNVDNTADASKPVSTAQQTAFNLKANLASPTFTGVPLAPTAPFQTTTDQIATTNFVQSAINYLVGSAPAALDTLNELAAALDNDASYASTITSALTLKAPLASPTFTGTVNGITKSMVGLGSVDNTSDTNKPVSTAQQTALNLKANLASPTFTGTPAVPTAATSDSSTTIASTAFVKAQGYLTSTPGGDVTLNGIQTLTNKTLTSPIIKDSSGGTSIDVASRNLYAADGTTITVYWWDGGLSDTSGTAAANWMSRFLYDSSGSSSADWSNRQLITADGATTALSWSNDDFLSVGLPLHSNSYISCGVSTLNNAPTASVAGLGAQLVITDAFLPNAGSVVSGGGSSSALVMSNGNNWIVTAGVGTELTPAQIMSKAGEQLIASLQAVVVATPGTAYFATTKATSGTFQVKTSTGYARLINADGSLGAQAGGGVATTSITLTIPASGLHRALGVLSVANGGSSRSGNITSLTIGYNQLTTFSGTGLSSLTILGLYGNQLTSINLAGASSLQDFQASANQLTTFDATGWGLNLLSRLDLAGNRLTRLLCPGSKLSYKTYASGFGYFGSSVSSNRLSASALNDFFTSLGANPQGNQGVLSVQQNPGSATCDPTIATAKNYIVGTSF